MMRLILLSLAILFCSISHASLFGEIQRFQVNNASLPPYNSIGQVNDFCSGSVISFNKVLTAAHCVFDFENQTLMPVNSFHIGRNGISQLGQSFQVLSAEVHPLYPVTGDPHFDVAVLTLNVPYGVTLNPLPLSQDLSRWVFDPDLFAFVSIGSIIGYPGDKLLGTMWSVPCFFERRISHFDRPHYTCDTFGGMSGSPLLQIMDGQVSIIGVHTNGGSKNSGLFLRNEILSFIQSALLK